MNYSTTIQLTLFQNLDSTGKVEGKPQYGCRIYSDFGSAEYCNTYDSVSELLDEVSVDTVLDFVKDKHPDLYDNIIDDGGFIFINEHVDLNDLSEPTIMGTVGDDDGDYIGGRPFDGDEELQEEVEEVLEEAAKLLI